MTQIDLLIPALITTRLKLKLKVAQHAHLNLVLASPSVRRPKSLPDPYSGHDTNPAMKPPEAQHCQWQQMGNRFPAAPALVLLNSPLSFPSQGTTLISGSCQDMMPPFKQASTSLVQPESMI